MDLALVDLNADVVTVLRGAFAVFPEVRITCDDLVAVAHDTIVSPANSAGFMDGGIDAAYCEAIPNIERLVRDAIALRPEGHLPLGAALIVPVRHARIHHVIVATTMMSPEAVDAQNAYRAMHAILRTASTHTDRVGTLFCPGLCTGVGRVEPDAAAHAMAKAYAEHKNRR